MSSKIEASNCYVSIFQTLFPGWLSPSIHKFDNELIYSGLSAALGHEPFGPELTAEGLHSA